MWRSTATIAPDPVAGFGRRGPGARRFLWVAFVLACVGLALPYEWERVLRLDLRVPTLPDVSTLVLDRNGALLRAFPTRDGRWSMPVRAGEVDPAFLQLLIASEDKRFREHDGVDVLALARAAAQLALHRRIVSGASTLTMQVARLLEPPRGRALRPKLRQLLTALALERRIGKTRVLDAYLQLAPYGGNLQGVRAASLTYFGHEPNRLDLAEAALLVALPQSPERRRPDRYPQAARAARDRIIERAAGLGIVSDAAARSARAEPVPRIRSAFPASAPHAAEEARAAEPAARVLRLTLDARLQRNLEPLAKAYAARFGPRVSGALVVIDNGSGEIRARVGSADYASVERSGALDMTLAFRSPGSALKPFIYALAFENGIAAPDTTLEDRPTRYGAYAPENFDGTFHGSVSAREALQWSLNLPAVALLDEVGPPRFLARLREAGARIEVPPEAAPGLAVGLGGLGIRPIDMVRLYAGLARGGRVPPPEEGFGEAATADATRPVTDPASAYAVAEILRGVPPPTNALAGRIAFKTGTSYGYRDAWAVGFSRRFTVAAWLGRPDNAAVPGLVGREAAAPMLFDAFARLGAPIEALMRPPGLVASATALPMALRHLRDRDGAVVPRLRIAYPPDGATVDLDPGDAATDLSLKVEGGTPPFTWYVNGAPAGVATLRRQEHWVPDGLGFARLSVVDGSGGTDSVGVRLR